MFKQIIFVLLFVGIAVNAKVTREEIAAVRKELDAAIKVEYRCTTSSDCTTAPVGARACGGPNGYVVYAIKSPSAKNIRLLAEKTVQLERQYNEENSVISICSMVMAPTPICNQNSECAAGSAFSPFFSASLK